MKTADLFDVDQLTTAFKGGTTVFVLTPENPASTNIIKDTAHIIENYKKAIQASAIRKVVALSCIGAHIDGNTGNILMSRMLEQTLDTLDVEKIFIRPSYYFSNWLAYMDTIKQSEVLPTFFPADLKLDMHSAIDVAQFIAKVMTAPPSSAVKTIYELTGPTKYSSVDVANTFSKLLNKTVTAQQIPQESWKETLLSAGFTEDTAANLIDMTKAVIDHISVPENPSRTVKLTTSLEEYMKVQLNGEFAMSYT